LIDALGEKPSIGDRGLNPGIAKALANERENQVHRFLIAMPEPGLVQVGRVGHTVFVFGRQTEQIDRFTAIFGFRRWLRGATRSLTVVLG